MYIFHRHLTMASNTTETLFALHDQVFTEPAQFVAIALEDDDRPSSFLREEVRNIALMFFRAAYASINISGVVANVLNLMVYWKMGFSTTANISLFTLSLSDIMQNFFLLSMALYQDVFNEPARLRLSVGAITYLLTPVFRSVSAFASWVTATISVERCVSVALPMKVSICF